MMSLLRVLAVAEENANIRIRRWDRLALCILIAFQVVGHWA